MRRMTAPGPFRALSAAVAEILVAVDETRISLRQMDAEDAARAFLVQAAPIGRVALRWRSRSPMRLPSRRSGRGRGRHPSRGPGQSAAHSSSCGGRARRRGRWLQVRIDEAVEAQIYKRLGKRNTTPSDSQQRGGHDENRNHHEQDAKTPSDRANAAHKYAAPWRAAGPKRWSGSPEYREIVVVRHACSKRRRAAADTVRTTPVAPGKVSRSRHVATRIPRCGWCANDHPRRLQASLAERSGRNEDGVGRSLAPSVAGPARQLQSCRRHHARRDQSSANQSQLCAQFATGARCRHQAVSAHHLPRGSARDQARDVGRRARRP
jgi:hypothetical protein